MSMKTRPRPILRTLHITVLNRVQVNVIAQSIPIVFIPDTMLPVARLPDAAPALPVPASGDGQLLPTATQVMVREEPFDGRPPRRKVIVTFGKRPDAVQMVRQQHAREHVEGIRASGMDERVLK